MGEKDEIVIEKHHHQWKMRLSVGLVLLVLSFIGLVFSNVSENSAWTYWRVMVPVFAVFSLFLSWYLRRKQRINARQRIGRELAQWIGLMLVIYVMSTFVNIGLLGRFQAGLMTLLFLAFNMFIIGIYIEATFLAIGVALGIFAIAAALLINYTYTIMLPITIGVVVVLVWIARRRS